METCLICDRTFNSVLSLARHITSHKISVEEYAKRYFIKHPCNACGEPGKFISLKEGFDTWCI